MTRASSLCAMLASAALVRLLGCADSIAPAPEPRAEHATPPANSGNPSPLTCVQACERAKRRYAECTADRRGASQPQALATEIARIDQLDCAADCPFWAPAEVTRVDACFPSTSCSAYSECLERSSASSTVEPTGTKSRARDGAEMVLVPAGPAVIGAPTGLRSKGELAAQKVEVAGFYIDRDEVSVKRYFACVKAGGCTPASADVIREATTEERVVHKSDDEHETETISIDRLVRRGCNWGIAGRDEHPINCVTQLQAAAYCAWAGARLPSEVEWEKAARGPGARRYPWGPWSPSCARAHMDETGDSATRGCSTRTTAAAGARPSGSSPYGVRDAGGNVWEWMGGHFERDALADPSQDQRVQSYGDSFGVLRGGGWGVDDGVRDAQSENLETTRRFRFFKHLEFEGVGFRCVEPGP